eukprot:4877055-Ditylum_brightwellii.AAC.1
MEFLVLPWMHHAFHHSTKSLLHLEAIIRTAGGNGEAAGNSLFTVMIDVDDAAVIAVITAYSIIETFQDLP